MLRIGVLRQWTLTNKVMSFSYYEIYTTSLRAFSSMGFPYGADEDAAYIIAWLELNKFNALNSLVNSIKVVDNKYDGKINPNALNNSSIDLNYSSLLMKGPGLIDFYQSELDDKKDLHVTLNNCPNPEYLLPLLYRSSKKIYYCNAIWLNTNNHIQFCEVENNIMKIGIVSNQKLVNKKQVRIYFSNKQKIHKKFNSISFTITSKTIQDNLANGISPNENNWKIISKLAAKTFVPESEESRIKGAGGSDDAND